MEIAEVRLLKKHDLCQVRALALDIFPATYKEIVPAEQIDYMMDMFYTDANLLIQFEEGQSFMIIYSEGIASGFASYSKLSTPGHFKLNKIYVDHRRQGLGLGKTLLKEVISRVRAVGALVLELNVNKLNKATGFYRNMGFVVKEEVLLDIGSGFFMDDYVMALKLTEI